MMRPIPPNALLTRPAMAGLTLVEVMIAMTIGLIILAALSNVLVNNLRTSREIEQVGRHVEDGRFALQTMIDDLSNAGFYGGADTAGATSQPNFCDTATIHQEILTPNLGVGSTKPDCAAVNMKANTRWLAIRRYTTNGRSGTTAPTCPTDMTCVQIEPNGTPKYAEGSLSVRLHDGTTYAPVYIPLLSIYYVDVNNRLRRIGLKWDDGKAIADDTVLVEGIEMIGFEVEGNGVRINLLSRADQPTPGMKAVSKAYPPFVAGGDEYTTNDNYRRNYYSVVVNIYNNNP